MLRRSHFSAISLIRSDFFSFTYVKLMYLSRKHEICFFFARITIYRSPLQPCASHQSLPPLLFIVVLDLIRVRYSTQIIQKKKLKKATNPKTPNRRLLSLSTTREDGAGRGAWGELSFFFSPLSTIFCLVCPPKIIFVFTIHSTTYFFLSRYYYDV